MEKRMKKNRNKRAIAFLMIGFLLLLGAGGVLGYNLYEDMAAGEAAKQILIKMEHPKEQSEEGILLPDGRLFCGVLSIEKEGITLPVYQEWSYKKLKEAPCRYKGSAKGGDLIIAAHNYKNHFGSLSSLEQGDRITFTDGEGTLYSYRVDTLSRLDGTAIEQMHAGEWELTLFTCTKGGKQRVTVRCIKE